MWRVHSLIEISSGRNSLAVSSEEIVIRLKEDWAGSVECPVKGNIVKAGGYVDRRENLGESS